MKLILHSLGICVASLLAISFSYNWTGEDALKVIYSLEPTPYSYRVLMPWIARSLVWMLGISANTALMVVIVLSSIALLYALWYLFEAFYPNHPASILIAFCAEALIFVLIMFPQKIYDLSTAAFFALSLSFLARTKVNWYLLLFPLATLNRETTFLLILFFAIYYFRKPEQMPVRRYIFSLSYQILCYVGIKIILTEIFAKNGGSHFFWWPDQVIATYIQHFGKTFTYIFLFALIVYLAHRNQETKPQLLVDAFLVMAPVLLVLHLFMGYPYEVRMFVEVAPAALLLCLAPVQRSEPEAHSSFYS